MKLDILFLISHKPDNRYKKRIALLSGKYSVGMIYWNKERVPQNIFIDDTYVEAIDIPADRTNPLKRIPETIKFLRASYEAMKKLDVRCVYTGNLDMLMAAVRFKERNKNVKIIYEIADLHRLIIDRQKGLGKRWVSAFLKEKERKLSKEIDCLVLTSMKFYEVYYRDFIDREKVVFLPNIPEERSFEGFEKEQHDKFTVGFIGWIRYKDQLKMLIDSADRANVNVVFAGEDGEGPDFEEYCRQFKHCSFLGAFDHSAQIQEMYKKVDCVYAVYDADMANVRVALPNKLYEAVLCAMPIIVAKNTYLSELVSDMGVGIAVDHKNGDELTEVLKQLSGDQGLYDSICSNCRIQKKKINLQMYNSSFLEKISKIVGG